MINYKIRANTMHVSAVRKSHTLLKGFMCHSECFQELFVMTSLHLRKRSLKYMHNKYC